MDYSKYDDDYKNAGKVGDFNLIPPGEYLAYVDKVELGQTKNFDPMFKWTFKIADGEFEGRYAWTNNTFGANSIKFLKHNLQCCGLEIKSMNELKDDAVLRRLLDRVVVLKITVKEGRNQTFIKEAALPDVEMELSEKRQASKGSDREPPF